MVSEEVDLSLVGFFDTDYSGYKVDKKKTSGTCQFLANPLVSWSSKKQKYVALSTTKAEYTAAGACCAQFLRIKQQLSSVGLDFGLLLIKC